MKRPRTKKKTEWPENKPKEDIYKLSIWCRWQDYSFDCMWTLWEMLEIKTLLMQSEKKRIEIDTRTFRTQCIDVIRIRQVGE